MTVDPDQKFLQSHARTAVSVHATAVAVAVKPYELACYRSGRVKSFTTRIGR